MGNIRAARDLTYVHDTAKALIAVIESDVPNGDVVNVGSDTTYTVEWLAYKLADIMGVPDMEIRHNPRRLRRLDLDHLRCDNSKLRRYTDWSPQIGIEEGLRKTVEWYKQNGHRWCWEDSMSDVHFNEAAESELPPEIVAEPVYQESVG